MRRLSLCSVVLLAVFVTACTQDAPTGPATSQLKPAFNRSDKFQVNERIPFTRTVIACTERIRVEGVRHILLTITQDESGGFHVQDHSNTQGAEGVGLTSGDKYRFIVTSSSHIYAAGDFFPLNFTLTNPLLIIRQGEAVPADDLRARLISHLTINANGEVTSSHFEFEAECS